MTNPISSDLRTLEIQCIGSVISAEKFKKESQEGIKHNIKAERRAFGVLEAGVPDQKAENDQVSLTFPYFSRPKGLRAIRLVRQSGRRVQDSVSKPRGMAECVPVHKIGDPANRLAKDDGVTISANGRIGIFFFFKKKYAATQAKMTPPCIAMPPCQT